MLEGVMLLWFLLAEIALLFVAIGIRTTPESPVLKWGVRAVECLDWSSRRFPLVLGRREPLPGLHERYVAVRWRQTLGSTMHCVAGDGVGILVMSRMPQQWKPSRHRDRRCWWWRCCRSRPWRPVRRSPPCSGRSDQCLFDCRIDRHSAGPDKRNTPPRRATLSWSSWLMSLASR